MRLSGNVWRPATRVVQGQQLKAYGQSSQGLNLFSLEKRALEALMKALKILKDLVGIKIDFLG